MLPAILAAMVYVFVRVGSAEGKSRYYTELYIWPRDITIPLSNPQDAKNLAGMQSRAFESLPGYMVVLENTAAFKGQCAWMCRQDPFCAVFIFKDGYCKGFRVLIGKATYHRPVPEGGDETVQILAGLPVNGERLASYG